VKSVIEKNSERLQALNATIKETWIDRHVDQKSYEAWKRACAEFHSSFDALAFPGGLGRAMSLLAKQDPEIIEQVLQFLEFDPFFFRSGYIKVEFIRHLRHWPLTDDQKARLQKVIIARIYEKGRREFRWYCRLAKYVTDSEFEALIEQLAAVKEPKLVARQASWVLAQLKQ
jgi:hypothetical protein